MAPKRVLAIDDEPDVLIIIRTALEGMNVDVDTAKNGPDALALANENTYDLIILDVMMPGMDGFEVLRRLKDNEKTFEAPVVMLTGLAEKAMIKLALDEGVSHYLVKPFDFQEFLQVINEAMGADPMGD